MGEDEPLHGATQDAGRRGDQHSVEEGKGTFRRAFDSQTESVGMAVISAVAAVSNTDPKEMEPLHQILDMDALDAIFHPGSDGRVMFPYNGYEVVVRSDGVITVTPDARG